MAKSDKGICLFAGCINGVKSKNLCNGHYQQAKAGKPLRPLTSSKQPVKCSFGPCVNFAICKGLCDGHYQQYRKGKELTSLQIIRIGCIVNGCGEKHEAYGYCVKHYNAWSTHGDPLFVVKPPSTITEMDGILYVSLGNSELKMTASVEDRPKLEGKRLWLTNQGYACFKLEGKRINVSRYLLEIEDVSVQIDHIDGVRHHNHRSNLRIVTHELNMQNKPATGKTGHRNVFYEESKNLYRVIVIKDGVRHHGGRHKKLEDAVTMAQKMRAELFTHHNEDRSTTD